MANIKIARLWSASASAPAAASKPSPKLKAVDSLDAFGPEAEDDRRLPKAADAASADTQRRLYVIAAAVALILAATGAAAYWRVDRLLVRTGTSDASLTIETTPAGADVLVGGVDRGKTPLTMSFSPGEQNVEVIHAGVRKNLRVPLKGGATVVHHVTFDVPAAAPPVSAILQVTTEPSRLRVSVDGTPRGTSPLTLESLTPGSHTVQVAHPAGVLTRTVDLKAGETTSLLLSGTTPPAEGATGGWLAVSSSELLQLVEKGQVIGSTQASRLMLPAGRHEIELVSEALGYRERRTVQIPAGGTASVRVDLPKVPLSVNALPWAEVTVDGTRLGETPIGNHPVTIGSHEIVFRHPQLGERRQTVVVTQKAPARVSIDLRKQ